MSNRRERTFKLLIYESEYREIQAWTNKHQELETGGDLFGLWVDDWTAVIQLVVGPGKQCRRTSASFYQDIDYLKRMGDALTLEEGLCHIGEWHSHHKLNIPRPSGGDESTVWSNMSRYGISRFILLIANISTTWKWLQLTSVPVDITVNGFLFEFDRQNQRLPILQAESIYLSEESPFRSKYLDAIREGAESLNNTKDQLWVVAMKCREMELERRKILQEKQELEDSLAAQLHKRQEAEKELQRTKQQTYQFQTSLEAQKRTSEEAGKIFNGILQDLKEREILYQQRIRELETSLTTEKLARNDLEAALAEEHKAHEETRRNTSCAWILNRDEIALSTTVIREEDWGSAFKGSFYRCEVVVKEIKPQILSGLDSSFLEREMKMAFECRHPCLLHFFGASYDQIPLFVFELPDTSLKAVIQQQPLESSEITNIALDVAKGLNYLHTKSPDPIVHGDISSANVLLWEKGGASWQAKISDFCTMHLLQQSMTDFPLDSIYAAPEAKDSKSPKVDVYSFGVLLYEMNTRELPDKNRPEQRMAKLPHHYERLIKGCVRQNPEERLFMETVIEKIEKFL